MIELWVRGVGLLGPGFTDWASGAAALRALAAADVGAGAGAGAGDSVDAGAAASAHPAAWARSPTVVPAPSRLAPNERRRAGTAIKAAIAVADQAVAMADADPAQLATVFTSSTGDPANCHALCEALATPERLVSPTRFTNSVHNTPAGYWHIATQSRRASTSLAALDASFGAGLLEAAVACEVSGEEVLLVACDVPYPAPLHALRPIADTMAVALLLAPRTSPRRGPFALRVALQADAGATVDETTATPCAHAGLEALRREIPAARALPLLWALAGCAVGAPVHGAGLAATVGADLGADLGGADGSSVRLEAAEGCDMAITVQACP